MLDPEGGFLGKDDIRLTRKCRLADIALCGPLYTILRGIGRRLAHCHGQSFMPAVMAYLLAVI